MNPFGARFAISTGLLACLLIPAAVVAQTSSAQSARDAQAQASQAVAPQRPPFLRAYFLVDSTSMTAADTFDAVLGTSRLTMRGAGGEVLNLWRGLFARVAFSSVSETGSRVDVFDDEVTPLDVPVTVEMRPLEIAAGWRMRPFAAGRLTPYAGGGLLRLSYRETSEFADTGDDTDTTFSGALLFGGIEASIVSWVVAGAEVQYRTVPNAIGEGGVSAVFEESNLGGFTVRFLVGVRR